MSTIRKAATEAIRYWEPRRILYNVVLGAVVLYYFVRGLPYSKTELSLDLVLLLFALAVGANVAYCAAYIADVFAQLSGFRDLWLRNRWVLLAVGIAFAAVLTRWFSMGLFLADHR